LKFKIFLKKAKRKSWKLLVDNFRYTRIYPFLYKSYWHSIFFKPKKTKHHLNYFTAIPRQDAGIGHQMANWIAGFWYAKQLGLKFVHFPFYPLKWDEFLGFGANEVLLSQIVKKENYVAIKLPKFNEENYKEVTRTKNIIKTYQHKKIIFFAEQDQFYFNQFGNMQELQEKFYAAPIRKKEKLIYNPEYTNIAIHVRRGDIVAWQKKRSNNENLRWQDNDYFVNTLVNALTSLIKNKPYKIYLFSQGEIEDFKEFERFENLNYCLDMNAQDSFLHMVYADILITSKSSFSYKPALLNKGTIISPQKFWHGYPSIERWILTDEEGNFIKK